VTVEGGTDGATRASGNPIKLSAFGDPPHRDPAPDLDADRARILAELED
jgi:CoA:oxalate CoA-transferase